MAIPRRTFLASLAAAFTLAPRSLPAQDAPKYTLRYRFTPGESVFFVVHNDTSRKVTHSGRDVTSQDSVDALKHYRVLSTDAEGGASLELTIDRTRMRAEQGNVVYNYDSATDKNPPEQFLTVHRSVGRPWLHVTVNALGETTNFQTPSGTPVLEAADFVSRVLPILPSQPVAIGEVWKEQFTVDVPQGDYKVDDDHPLTKPMKMQRWYTLRSVDKDIATIELRTEILTPKRTPQNEMVLIQKKFSGTITVNIAEGRLLGRDLSIDGEVIGFDGPQTVMNMKLKQQERYSPAGASSALPPQKTVATEKSTRAN